jgi:hypothetical protein
MSLNAGPKVAKHREKTIMNRQAQVTGGDALTVEIADLSKASIADLRERWKTLYGKEPSGHISRSLMVRTIAYRLQERAFGGLKPSTQRVLDRIGASRSAAALEPTPKRRASAGTVLIRQWRGVSHRVTVLDHDVIYRGRRYKSLSEVARAITGTHWSGPLFFGLKNRTKEVANG